MEMARKQDVIVAAILQHEKSINDIDGQIESIEAIVKKVADSHTKIMKEIQEEAKKDRELKEREDQL